MIDWSKWVGPTLAVAIFAGVFSVGALYSRVSTLEDSMVANRDLSNRLARVESSLGHIDHQLDQIEGKLDRR